MIISLHNDTILFEGRSTRVVAQLHTYNPSNMIEKTGLEINIFNTDPWNNDLEGQEKERKNKTHKVSRAMSEKL